MIIRGKLLAIGAAGVVALGGAGLYAGSLSVTASGTLGAGEVATEASCLGSGSSDVTPGFATYNDSTGNYEYSQVTLDTTPQVASACDTKYATVTVIDSDNSIVAATNPTAISSDTTGAMTFASSATVDAGASTYSYAVVIQDSNS